MVKRFWLFVVLASFAGLRPVAAQQPPAAGAAAASTICGSPVPPPRALPPVNSGPVVYLIAPCFEAQGNQSVIEVQTYLYYIQLKPSQPSQGIWIPYDETTEKTILADFRRLWGTNFLDNLWIDVKDYTFSNGVVGKLVTYNMEERQRVKIVDYTGSKKVEVSKIEEKLKDASAEIRLDTFIDPGLVRKVAGIVTDMMKEKGFQYAKVTPEIQALPGGPKLVHLTFKMDEGPNVKIQKIDFIGNKAFGDGELRHQMKDNKQNEGFSDLAHVHQWVGSWFGGHSFQENKFDEDAEKISEFYRDHGYINARIGAPELKVNGDSEDGKTRWIELRVPVTEGARYKVGDFTFEGNTVVKSDYLKPMFKLAPGEYYSEKAVRKGLEKAREVYGAGGYFEFTGYPDLKPRDAPLATPEAPEALRAPDPPKPAGPPVVDVVMRMQEGKQYFVNRITFLGNTTTRDNVIRRELRLVEDGVFNTEALKYSIKRLNQLGYFKPLENGKDVNVDKTPGEEAKVDVKLKLEEQNRNQVSFGAGVSEFEGFFGQASFQTANFLGRGESLTLSMQAGSRAQNYSIAFTEPFLFDRNITGGAQVFRSDIRYISQFTQQSTGGVLTFGFPVGDFTRMFTNYSYQRVRVTEISDVYCNPTLLASNPYLRDSLQLSGTACTQTSTGTTTGIDPVTGLPTTSSNNFIATNGGERIISKVTPSLVHNTVDNPITPTQGKRFTLSLDLAGLGGNTNFFKPLLEGVWYWKQNNRMSLGWRAQYQYIHTFSGSKDLPIFEKLFLGGEYDVRGFDLRTIGPSDCQPGQSPFQGTCTGLVLGGNKSLLFNLEELITIAGPVRLVLFYDAGQVQPGPELQGPAAFVPLGTPIASTVKPGRNFNWQDFKTSTGAEIRFFMPVLNVPFRLIFAYDPQRQGVLNDTLQPQAGFSFKFAVGSTF